MAKKLFQCKTLLVKVWDKINTGYKFSKEFNPNPFRSIKDLEFYLKSNGCESGDEYYIDTPGVEDHRIIH